MKRISPSTLLPSLEGGEEIDIGWPAMTIRYTKDDHTGCSYVDTAMITSDGSFRR